MGVRSLQVCRACALRRVSLLVSYFAVSILKSVLMLPLNSCFVSKVSETMRRVREQRRVGQMPAAPGCSTSQSICDALGAQNSSGHATHESSVRPKVSTWEACHLCDWLRGEGRRGTPPTAWRRRASVQPQFALNAEKGRQCCKKGPERHRILLLLPCINRPRIPQIKTERKEKIGHPSFLFLPGPVLFISKGKVESVGRICIKK